MESGWNVWVWIVGVVSRRRVWLVGVGVVSRRWVWVESVCGWNLCVVGICVWL